VLAHHDVADVGQRREAERLAGAADGVCEQPVDGFGVRPPKRVGVLVL